MDKAPAAIVEHYCMHPCCRSWGSFGFEKRYGLERYCGEHLPPGRQRAGRGDVSNRG
ncbi:hypothetical protein SAMN05428967_3414 [Phyllobacterium sp. YR620]|nr:hypothetical protein SAMN05428967_3414 [Phyllobacterium sp. YR620]